MTYHQYQSKKLLIVIIKKMISNKYMKPLNIWVLKKLKKLKKWFKNILIQFFEII